MSDKENKEAFRKKAVPAFVDLLQMAKQAIILYRKRENEGEAPTFEEISFQEVLMTANCMVAVGFAARDPDGEAVHAVSELVQLDSGKVHDSFTAELERQKLDVPAARRICAALVSTAAGNDMLRVMLYDAVVLKRKNEAKAGGPPAGPMG